MKKVYMNKIICTICATTLLCSFTYAEQYDTAKVNSDINTVEVSENTDEISIFAEQSTTSDSTIKPQEIIYASYTFGENATKDVSTGGLGFNAPKGNISQTNDVWVSSANNENCGNYSSIGDRTSYFTTGFNRGSSSGTACQGFLFFNVDNSAITSGDKHFFIEIDYYGNTAANLAVQYAKGEGTANASVKKARNNSNEWETMVFEINDAYFNGGNTALASGAADFRINANSADSYISAVRIYNSDNYKNLLAALESFDYTINSTTPISSDFNLPTTHNDYDILWSSDDETVISISDGAASVHNPEYYNQEITLTAKLLSGNYYISKDFKVTVKARERLVPTVSMDAAPQITTTPSGKKVVVSVSHANETSSPMRLIAFAKNKESGKLSSPSTATANQVAGAQLLEADVPLGINDDLTYFIINDIGASLLNCPPTAVKNVKIKPDSLRSNIISWDPSTDDYDYIKSYTVKIDDLSSESVVAKLPDGKTRFEYKVEGLEAGKNYNVSITATDHADIVSEAKQVTMTFPKPGYSIIGTDDDAEDGLTFKNDTTSGTADAFSIKTSIGGVACHSTTTVPSATGGTKPTFLYFKTDNSVVSDDAKNVIIEVKYYDSASSGNIRMRYNSIDASGNEGLLLKNVATFTGTDTWKTATVTIDDARFTAPSKLSSCDFRFEADSTLYISEVYVLSPDMY